MTQDRPALGIALMVLTMLIFAAQDGISRYLADAYNVPLVVMLRYWFFAVFVLALSATRRGGIRGVARTSHIWLQMGRGVLLVVEILIMVTGFVRLGLVESHAIFATFPLIVTALSIPVLGEVVGWRRWAAMVAGFVGVLVILQPGFRVFSPDAIIPLVAATLFALYHILTRLASRSDRPETSFFWTGIGGAVTITLIGPFFWEPVAAGDWKWVGALCCTAALGHYMLIQALTVTQANTLQPFAYLQLVFAGAIGVTVFGEAVTTPTLVGASIVVAAGIFTILRQRHS